MRVPLQRVKSCKFCLDFKGQPKPISPENFYRAKRMPDGSFKCHICQEEELKDRIVRVTPNSIRAREIIEERESKKRGVI